jgi:hypothetical protein
MVFEKMVGMNQGQEETSYARNSSIQVSAHFLIDSLILFLTLSGLLICSLTLGFSKLYHQEIVHNMAYTTEI